MRILAILHFLLNESKMELTHDLSSGISKSVTSAFRYVMDLIHFALIA